MWKLAQQVCQMSHVSYESSHGSVVWPGLSTSSMLSSHDKSVLSDMSHLS